MHTTAGMSLIWIEMILHVVLTNCMGLIVSEVGTIVMKVWAKMNVNSERKLELEVSPRSNGYEWHQKMFCQNSHWTTVRRWIAIQMNKIRKRNAFYPFHCKRFLCICILSWIYMPITAVISYPPFLRLRAHLHCAKHFTSAHRTNSLHWILCIFVWQFCQPKKEEEYLSSHM